MSEATKQYAFRPQPCKPTYSDLTSIPNALFQLSCQKEILCDLKSQCFNIRKKSCLLSPTITASHEATPSGYLMTPPLCMR